jgi:hemoglobin
VAFEMQQNGEFMSSDSSRPYLDASDPAPHQNGLAISRSTTLTEDSAVPSRKEKLRCVRSQDISDTSIHQLVDRFYTMVREDALLRPVFDNVLQGSWSTHLPRMVAFWSSVLLGTRQFQGNVYGKHMALAGITEQHFVQWIKLFKQATLDIFDDVTAATIFKKADQIATSLQLGYFGKQLVPF